MSAYFRSFSITTSKASSNWVPDITYFNLKTAYQFWSFLRCFFKILALLSLPPKSLTIFLRCVNITIKAIQMPNTISHFSWLWKMNKIDIGNITAAIILLNDTKRVVNKINKKNKLNKYKMIKWCCRNFYYSLHKQLFYKCNFKNN